MKVTEFLRQLDKEIGSGWKLTTGDRVLLSIVSILLAAIFVSHFIA